MNKWTPPREAGGIPGVSTRFSLSGENEQAGVSRDQILRHERGWEQKHFPCFADHEQGWQPYPVDPYSVISYDHTFLVPIFVQRIQVPSMHPHNHGIYLNCVYVNV